MMFTKKSPLLRSRDRVKHFASAGQFPFSKVSTMSRGHTGFTLAEVLITLGIIGIVAAMTIPTLVNKISDNELKSMWKKEYSVISSAFGLVRSDNENSLYYNSSSSINKDAFTNSLLSKLNTVKICNSTNGNSGECGHAVGKWRTLAGLNIPYSFPDSPSAAILADGSLLGFGGYSGGNCGITSWPALMGTNYCFVCFVDVNGFKSPNQLGYDIFAVDISSVGVLPMGNPKSPSSYSDCSRTSTQTDYNRGGIGCSNKAILGIEY